MDEPTEEELAATPDPPEDLTYEEAIGWRHGWLAARSRDAEAVTALHAIAEQDAADPEAAHSNADDVLLAHVSPEVRAAYERVVSACKWWAYA